MGQRELGGDGGGTVGVGGGGLGRRENAHGRCVSSSAISTVAS